MHGKLQANYCNYKFITTSIYLHKYDFLIASAPLSLLSFTPKLKYSNFHGKIVDNRIYLTLFVYIYVCLSVYVRFYQGYVHV